MTAETFFTLLHDAAHWEFELFLILVFDVLIGALVWPRIRRHIHRDVSHIGDVPAHTCTYTQDERDADLVEYMRSVGFEVDPSVLRHRYLEWRES